MQGGGAEPAAARALDLGLLVRRRRWDARPPARPPRPRAPGPAPQPRPDRPRRLLGPPRLGGPADRGQPGPAGRLRRPGHLDRQRPRGGSPCLEDQPPAAEVRTRSRRSLSPPARAPPPRRPPRGWRPRPGERSGPAGPAPRPVPARLRRAAVPAASCSAPSRRRCRRAPRRRARAAATRPARPGHDRSCSEPGPHRAGHRPRRPPGGAPLRLPAPGTAGSTAACRPARPSRSAARTRCRRGRPAGRGQPDPRRPTRRCGRIGGALVVVAEVDNGPNPVRPQRPPGRVSPAGSRAARRGRPTGSRHRRPADHPGRARSGSRPRSGGA